MNERDEARFWSKVDKSGGPNACWPWTGSRLKARGGYGQIKLGGRVLYAHRIALELSTGRSVEAFACHRCNRPPCCNPAHLYDGTPKENSADAARLGRMGKWDRSGERNPSAKLTVEKVAEVRERLARGERKAAIARSFGVSRTAIHLIATGGNWSTSRSKP